MGRETRSQNLLSLSGNAAYSSRAITLEQRTRAPERHLPHRRSRIAANGDRMLARMTMEPRFFDWNRKWGAPAGLEGQSLVPDAVGGVISAEAQKEISRLGMFSAQPNNTRRVFEYPWAYFHADLGAHMRLLEIGGALSGFQFVLSREGHEVDNVD